MTCIPRPNDRKPPFSHLHQSIIPIHTKVCPSIQYPLLRLTRFNHSPSGKPSSLLVRLTSKTSKVLS